MTTKDELYPKIRDMPYYQTKVSAERTKAQMETLLEKYGIENHQWTKYEAKESLKFQIDTIVQGVKINKMVMLELPEVKARKWNNRYYEVVDVPRGQRMRILYYTLKSILETTQYGFFKLEDIFLSYILTQLPDGSIKQVKDILKEHPLLLGMQTEGD